jgi:hypothetical protein
MTRLQDPARGFMASVGLEPAILVSFQYNPLQLADKRAVNYATIGAPGQLFPERQYSSGGDRTISFTVRVDAIAANTGGSPTVIDMDETGGITPELNKYRAFVYPANRRWTDAGASFVRRPALYAGSDAFASPPLCRFGFGEGRVLDCVVTEISITELLFNSALSPLRADVSITLVELAPYGDELAAS